MKPKNLHDGLKTKSPAQNSGGRKAQSEAGSMNSESTRNSVAKSHSLGGRTA
jgi:hypothetical protein